MQLKTALLIALLFPPLTGCHVLQDPNFGTAMSRGSANYNQQVNQQLTTQQETWNQTTAENQRLREQSQTLDAIKRSQGHSVYNSATGKYQYVPPGWHEIWDSQNHTWIIQP